MDMNDNIVQVHGEWTVLDRRHMNYDKSALAPEDDEHTRAWARDFYLANEAYLRSSTHTREGLAFFFKTWYSSSAADDTRANVPPRRFSQILVALRIYDLRLKINKS